ncbi:Fc.00g107250.m01.CDS01 [Cosmosporella sp. VM-42]
MASAKLCTRCTVLQLDDDLSTWFNRLELDQRSAEQEHKLDWEIEDSYPDTFNQRKAVGCDFCDFLYSILFCSWAYQKDMTHPDRTRTKGVIPIRMSLFHVYRLDTTERHALRDLRVKIQVGMDPSSSAQNSADRGNHEDGERDIHIDLPIAAATGADGQSSLNFRPPLSHLDDEPMKWMKSRINACVAHNHVKVHEDFLPNRLIKVDEAKPRLVLTKDLRSRASQKYPLPHYAALTYCWGPPPHSDAQFKTTSLNIHELIHEIPASQLPQAIRDSIAATKALGIPYLWVDALCILQDVASDWDMQCTLMVKIYGSAHVTLTAAASPNCEQGYVRRNDRVLLPMRSSSNGSEPRVYAVYHPSYRKPANEELVVTSWVNRGWTFQERLSSTRMLLFGKSNIHFQCPDEHMSMGKYQLDFDFNMLNHPLLQSGDRSLIYEEWATEVAAEFSCYGFEFTRGTDIFPSIAGMATLFSNLLKDEYLAGLWKGDLYRCLNWALHRTEANGSYTDMLDALQCPVPYLAPSWSWVSRPGLVIFDVYWSVFVGYTRSEFTILNTSVTLKGISPFGELTGGTLELFAKVYKGSRSLRYREVDDSGGIFRKTLELEGEYLFDIETDCATLDMFEDGRNGPELCAPIAFMLVGSTIREPRYEKGKYPGKRPPSTIKDPATTKRLAYGLLIIPGPDPDEFYRVGTWRSEANGIGGLDFFGNKERWTVKLI